MIMQTTPKGLRLHIGLFGRRNVGKSSLLNAIAREQVAIVSDQAGTTTDPVEKPMELLPLGPVVFVDTAGVDDQGTLGTLRIQKTHQVFERTDVAVIVTEAGQWGDFEHRMAEVFIAKAIPVIVVANKSDLYPSSAVDLKAHLPHGVPVVTTAAISGRGLGQFRQALIDSAPDDFINAPHIIADLVKPGDLAVMVVPIDKEAPKGRLILPQVQTLRDLLDSNAGGLVIKEGELTRILANLKKPPALVVTDSQVFQKVAADTPPQIPLTSFSILFARYKGNLTELVLGTLAVDRLQPGDRVLIAEACSHHPIEDDIGRVKIPRWLNLRAGGDLDFEIIKGHDFPRDLAGYKLVVHCGACMHTRREMINRIMCCRRVGVPISNYGLVIAYCLGIFERALGPFDDALGAYYRAKDSAGNRE
jgi:[FeFe] hydrogenase H-cluster maturation GTPase HydF